MDCVQSTDVIVAAGNTNAAASQELFAGTGVIDTFNPSSLHSPTETGYDQQIAVQSTSVAPVEYQMLMSLPMSSVSAPTDADVTDVGTVSLTHGAAVSGAGPIIVGISLPTIDNLATYQAFPQFDLQNARLLL